MFKNDYSFYFKIADKYNNSTSTLSPSSPTGFTDEQLILLIVLPILAFLIFMAIFVLYLVKVKWKPRRRIDIEKVRYFGLVFFSFVYNLPT